MRLVLLRSQNAIVKIKVPKMRPLAIYPLFSRMIFKYRPINTFRAAPRRQHLAFSHADNNFALQNSIFHILRPFRISIHKLFSHSFFIGYRHIGHAYFFIHFAITHAIQRSSTNCGTPGKHKRKTHNNSYFLHNNIIAQVT